MRQIDFGVLYRGWAVTPFLQSAIELVFLLVSGVQIMSWGYSAEFVFFAQACRSLWRACSLTHRTGRRELGRHSRPAGSYRMACHCSTAVCPSLQLLDFRSTCTGVMRPKPRCLDSMCGWPCRRRCYCRNSPSRLRGAAPVGRSRSDRSRFRGRRSRRSSSPTGSRTSWHAGQWVACPRGRRGAAWHGSISTPGQAQWCQLRSTRASVPAHLASLRSSRCCPAAQRWCGWHSSHGLPAHRSRAHSRRQCPALH